MMVQGRMETNARVGAGSARSQRSARNQLRPVRLQLASREGTVHRSKNSQLQGVGSLAVSLLWQPSVAKRHPTICHRSWPSLAGRAREDWQREVAVDAASSGIDGAGGDAHVVARARERRTVCAINCPFMGGAAGVTGGAGRAE